MPQSLDRIQIINVDGGFIDDPTGEETLDTEWSSGIAPGARILVYATDSLGDVEDAFVRVIDDLQAGTRPRLHQISMSFGADEVSDETLDDIAAVHAYFTSISAFGVTLFGRSAARA